MSTEKFCVKCGKKFLAMGREVICPSCREAAKLEAKRAAVLKAKRASWNGESVPVRISGRASTVVRAYAKVHSLPFAAALDALLQSTAFFVELGGVWEDITPYKSRRTKKSTDGEQDAPQAASKPQDTPPSKPQVTKKAAKTSSKTASKATSKK